MLVLCTSARPKCFFFVSAETETAIFLSGRNRYQNQKKISVLVETENRNYTNSNMDVFREYAELPGNSKMTPKDKYCMI